MVSDLWLHIVVIACLLGIDLLGQAKAALHLVLAVLVEGARAFEDFLVLLIVVALGTRFINGGDDVVWPSVAFFTRLGSFWPITATVLTMATVVVAMVTMASVIGALVTVASWVVSFRSLLLSAAVRPPKIVATTLS